MQYQVHKTLHVEAWVREQPNLLSLILWKEQKVGQWFTIYDVTYAYQVGSC